jgi:hypothetical protein
MHRRIGVPAITMLGDVKSGSHRPVCRMVRSERRIHHHALQCVDDDRSQITVYNDRYRMVAALYTTPSKNLVSFKQVGDTFYLATPVADINTTTLGSSDTAEALGSVPGGFVVEALGRCVGGTATQPVLIYTPPSSLTLPGTPAAFPTAPGYTVQVTSPQVPSAFRLHTDTAKHIHAITRTGTTSLECMTDGWTWSRGK